MLADLLVTDGQFSADASVSDWIEWRPREPNREADALANLAMDIQQSCYYMAPQRTRRSIKRNVTLLAWSDGGHRGRSCSSAAVVLKAWHKNYDEPLMLVAVAQYIVDECFDSVQAEIRALTLTASILRHLMRHRSFAAQDVKDILGEESLHYLT